MFLTGTKWQMLEMLSKESLSPLEISKKLGTTIANISQQLRLLQTAGLVKKERQASSKPGKPRMLFSIAEDLAFITILSKDFAKKKLVKINPKQKEALKGIIKD